MELFLEVFDKFGVYVALLVILGIVVRYQYNENRKLLEEQRQEHRKMLAEQREDSKAREERLIQIINEVQEHNDKLVELNNKLAKQLPDINNKLTIIVKELGVKCREDKLEK